MVGTIVNHSINYFSMKTYTIFFNTLDYPNKWVLRGFTIPGGGVPPIPDEDFKIADTQEEIFKHVPPNLFPMRRDDSDHPSVVVTFI